MNICEEKLAEEIIATLCSNGFQAYLTGGAVRDMFRGSDPDDFDIVTNAAPEQVKKLFPNKKVKMVGNNFLVTLIDTIEVATYRTDKNNGFGRFNCVTTQCETLQEDLQRRDFTFNSLAICPYSGEVVDPFNGRKDLLNKVVRFVGDPIQRIEEDYLRMIRAARFACLIEGEVEKNSFNAICKSKELVRKISPERIRLELMKVMKYKKPSRFFEILEKTGILNIILPEMSNMVGKDGGQHHAETIFDHSMMVGDNISKKDPVLRLTGYLHDIGKVPTYDPNDDSFIDHQKVGTEMVMDILKRFKFTNNEISKICSLVSLHMRSFQDITPRSVRRLLKKISENDISWKDWFQLKVADKKGNLKSQQYNKNELRDVCLKIHHATHETKSGGFKITDLAVSGHDVMKKLNIKPGPEVGVILKGLLEKVLDDPTINDRNTLLKML